MMKKSPLFLTTFCFFFITSLFSQQIRNFPALSGKKDVPANCIIQAKDGYMWFGTNDGLIRFDGKKTLLFKREDGLHSSEITAIMQAGNNTLWVGHKDGKISLVKNNKADTFLLNNKLPEDKITGIYEDKNNVIWISTYGSGLYRYQDKALQQFTTKDGLGDDVIYGISQDNANNIWMGTDGGITILNPESKSFSTITSKNGLPDNIVRSICYNGSDQMIIAMQDSGLCFYDLKKKEIIQNCFFCNWSYGAIDGVAFMKERNEILFITEKKGFFSIKNGKIKLIDNTKGLASNELNALFIDREYNIWLASNKAVSLLYEQRHSFFTVLNNLPSNAISAVIAEADHMIWLASDKGLSMIMQDETGGFAVKNTTIAALKGNQVVCMMPDSKERIWLGTYGGGIIVYDKESKKVIELNAKNGLCDDNISNMVQDDAGNIWVATLGGGISKLSEGDDGKFTCKTYNEENGLGSSYVYQIACTKQNGILLAVDGGGLQKIENDNVISLSTKVKSKTVYSVIEDIKGNIWFTTNEDGLVRYDKKEFTYFTTKNGIRDPQAPILVAIKDKIVLIHSKGIDVINANDTKTVAMFDISETDIEPNLNAYFKDHTNQLWIATNNGLLSYRVEDTFLDTIAPKAFITNLKVQYKEYSVDSLIDFAPDQNSFIFEFAAVLLRVPDKIHYRYMLSGNDKEWIYAQGTNVAAYNNLSAGSYEFLVQASNGEGKWGPTANYKFSIATPLTQKWWFWLIVASAVILSVYLFLRYRLHALQKEKLLLEHKVTERTIEIKKQSEIIEEKSKALEQLSLVASKTDNVVIIMDAKGKLEYVNESFIRLNNITLEELTAQVGETIYEISNNPKIREIIDDCISRKQSVVYESVNVKVAGKKVWESSTLTPIFDEKGQLKKLIIIDTDITERKAQEEIIIQKNKDITDSIEYAHKIQRAILPPEADIKKAIPQSFVFYLMKDIVSGDFYWFTEKDDFAIIAAIDCTGHGVPGAFMSLIGYNILNQIVNEKDIHEPAAILQALNEGVINALYKNNPGNENKDGMDLALCKIYKNNKTIEFAGAMRPLWIVDKDGKLSEVRTTKMPIGSLPSSGYLETEYVNNVVECREGDTFYIFTDGYADQFGGEKAKKFTTGKLKQLLSSMKDQGMEEQKNTLHKTHLNWKGDQEQVDDILVIGFRV